MMTSAFGLGRRC